MVKNKRRFLKLVNFFKELTDIEWTSQNLIKLENLYFSFRDTLIIYDKSKIYEDVWHKTDISFERINLFPQGFADSKIYILKAFYSILEHENKFGISIPVYNPINTSDLSQN